MPDRTCKQGSLAAPYSRSDFDHDVPPTARYLLLPAMRTANVPFCQLIEGEEFS
jgi:hypothetical protein